MVDKKIAIMQPYLFPYIGYFQLIQESDYFIYYNDTQFIERGWINRNNFLINRQPKLLSVPLVKGSANKRINQVYVDYENKLYKNLLLTINQNYSKAPFYNRIFSMLEECMTLDKPTTIDSLVFNLNSKICSYLEMETKFLFSSDLDYDRECTRHEKILSIAKLLKAQTILFPPGSMALYKTSDFAGYTTHCVIPDFKPYSQNLKTFFPGMSIIDVLMFNSINSVKEILKCFKMENLKDEV